MCNINKLRENSMVNLDLKDASALRISIVLVFTSSYCAILSISLVITPCGKFS